MRYIKIPTPETVHLVNYDGTPAMQQLVKDGPLVPRSVSFTTFLLERCADPVFSTDDKGQKIDGGDAVFALVEARESIKAPKGGYIEISDVLYGRLLAATNKPEGGYIPILAHNWAPFIRAVREAASECPKECCADVPKAD